MRTIIIEELQIFNTIIDSIELDLNTVIQNSQIRIQEKAIFHKINR